MHLRILAACSPELCFGRLTQTAYAASEFRQSFAARWATARVFCSTATQGVAGPDLCWFALPPATLVWFVQALPLPSPRQERENPKLKTRPYSQAARRPRRLRHDQRSLQPAPD